MPRSRSRSRGRRVSREERGRSRERRPASAFVRGRSRSCPADHERTARALSVDTGRARFHCTPERAAHILDRHGDAAAADAEAQSGVNRPSNYRSHSVVDRAVGRTLANPDATRDAGRGRQFYFKTFSNPRGVGQAGVGFGCSSGAVCDTVAAIANPQDGFVVTSYPIPRALIDRQGRGPTQRLRPETDPPSSLSDSASLQLPSEAAFQPTQEQCATPTANI